MKIKLFVTGLLALALAAPAAAQTAPDDLQCFMLSNFFAKAAKDDRGKTVATQAVMFYLGRLDGHISPQAVAAITHSRLDPKTAGPQMMACAQRMGRAEQTLQAAISAQAPPTKH